MKSLPVYALVVLLAACSQPSEKPPPPPRVEKDTVIFEPTSPQTASIVSVGVEPRRETVTRFSGRLIWNEERTARIFTPFAGKVISIAVRPGDTVTQSQELAILASPELGSAQAEARKAEQDYQLAQKNLARVQELQAAGVAPAKDLQAAQAEEARTASERARTQARLKMYGTGAKDVDQRYVLRSPVSGVVVERSLNPGQELRPDAAPPGGLFVVSDPAQLWFVLDVSETSLGAIRPGLEVALATSALGEDRVSGRITHVADVVDPQRQGARHGFQQGPAAEGGNVRHRGAESARGKGPARSHPRDLPAR
jgi:cobalt-zinc-cadmium efflux system membrane fusion protein